MRRCRPALTPTVPATAASAPERSPGRAWFREQSASTSAASMAAKQIRLSRGAATARSAPREPGAAHAPQNSAPVAVLFRLGSLLASSSLLGLLTESRVPASTRCVLACRTVRIANSARFRKRKFSTARRSAFLKRFGGKQAWTTAPFQRGHARCTARAKVIGSKVNDLWAYRRETKANSGEGFPFQYLPDSRRSRG